MHVMQEENDTYDARMIFFFGYSDGHSSHLPLLNHECKIECLRVCVCVCVCACR